MAQATAEPSQKNEKAAAPASTDELLSQLAGNEIDRLLAEADAKPAPAELSRTNMDVAPPPAAPPPAEEASLSRQIDEIFVELEKGQSKEAPARAEPLAQGAERAALLEAAGFDAPGAAAAAPGDSQDPVHDAQPQGDERSELLRAAGFQSADQLADAVDSQSLASGGADSLQDLEECESLPIYLKPLAWINAPLVKVSPSTRQVMGKLGILTMVNALAVLAYVVFFRKH